MRPSEDGGGHFGPIRMRRVAIVAPRTALRDALVQVADAGCVQLDPGGEDGRSGNAVVHALRERVRRTGVGAVSARIAAVEPDLDALERAAAADLLAGEAELAEHAADAVAHGSVEGLLGWCPEPDVPPLAARLADVGAALVPLPAPRGVDPPTKLPGGTATRRSFTTLVSTYGTVPYPDVDPTLLAGVAYVLMFGMMFGDAGQGLLLLVAGLVIRAGRPRRFAGLRPMWPFVVGAGVTSTAFGVLYGEFFGPTGVLPVIWLAPLAQPIRLLAAAVGVGAVLLAGAYLLAIVNRWREGGRRNAVYASSGIAGAAVFLGLGWGHRLLPAGRVRPPGAGSGLLRGRPGARRCGVRRRRGRWRHRRCSRPPSSSSTWWSGSGRTWCRFARLAAFGLTHAALGWLVWSGTVALWRLGPLGMVGAVVLFVVGNALTFALEGLIAAMQALRLEYYELFSRIFVTEGRPFRPWHVPVRPRTDPAPRRRRDRLVDRSTRAGGGRHAHRVTSVARPSGGPADPRPQRDVARGGGGTASSWR